MPANSNVDDFLALQAQNSLMVKWRRLVNSQLSIFAFRAPRLFSSGEEGREGKLKFVVEKDSRRIFSSLDPFVRHRKTMANFLLLFALSTRMRKLY